MHKDTYLIAERMGKYLCQGMSASEELEFEAWLDEKPEHREQLNRFKGKAAAADLHYLSGLDSEAAWREQRFRNRGGALRFLGRGKWGRWAAAAVLAATVSMGLELVNWADEVRVPTDSQAATGQQDVAPGRNQAVLVLSDGRRIDLTDGLSTALAEVDGTAITGDGRQGMTYRAGHGDGDPTVTNRLVVPKAGMYSLTLSDGTRVWVNALSELEFPVAFAQDERLVMLKGEAFFEVKRDASRPFRVRVGDAVVDVLGTHFNVNAYAGSKTTLVSGSVAVSNGAQTRVLRPGEQAVVADGITVGKVDIARTVAWKEGEFLFKSDEIREIMAEVSRWYDVSVAYEGMCPERLELTGSVSRGANLSEVLAVLSFASGASFSVQDRQVTVKF